MTTNNKATQAQRKALIVRSEELANQLKELKYTEKEFIRNSKDVEDWIKETFRLDILLLIRTRNFVNDCLEKNIYPL